MPDQKLPLMDKELREPLLQLQLSNHKRKLHQRKLPQRKLPQKRKPPQNL